MMMVWAIILIIFWLKIAIFNPGSLYTRSLLNEVGKFSDFSKLGDREDIVSSSDYDLTSNHVFSFILENSEAEKHKRK